MRITPGTHTASHGECCMHRFLHTNATFRRQPKSLAMMNFLHSAACAANCATPNTHTQKKPRRHSTHFMLQHSPIDVMMGWVRDGGGCSRVHITSSEPRAFACVREPCPRCEHNNITDHEDIKIAAATRQRGWRAPKRAQYCVGFMTQYECRRERARARMCLKQLSINSQ